MRVLALDTTTRAGSAALIEGDRIVDERSGDGSRTHALRMPGEIVALADASHWPLSSIDLYAVASGPGSFTGLRIGIAFAKGIARALNIPLLVAPSMMGAAWNAGRGRVVVEYDALRGDVYRAIYQFDAGAVQTIEAPAVVSVGAPVPGGAGRRSAADASAAALLGLVGLKGGAASVDDPGAWQPAYGRPAEAEARRLARHAAS